MYNSLSDFCIDVLKRCYINCALHYTVLMHLRLLRLLFCYNLLSRFHSVNSGFLLLMYVCVCFKDVSFDHHLTNFIQTYVYHHGIME